MATTMTAAEIEAHLNEFTGDLERFPHICGTIYTPGVKFLAESCGAFWLLDVIASYQRQIQRCARKPGPRQELWDKLTGMQFWKLSVDLAKREGVVTCEDGDGAELIRQKIPMTDFPLAEVKVWVGTDDGRTYVMYLPSEH